jgi:curved DNA-binding protein CbpA
VQTFYQLLSVAPTATAEEIKRAFRSEIARYHPDKVQHLGKEFQEMAATRAAGLTEAYRTLMNVQLRAEYDRLCVDNAGTPASTAQPESSSTPTPPAPSPTHAADAVSTSDTPPGQNDVPPASSSSSGDDAAARGLRFASERRDRDSFVKNASLGKFRQAVEAEMGPFDESPAKSFDFDCATKPRGLFSRTGAHRFVLKFVARVDRAAVQEAWIAATQRTGVPVCVFLLGNGVAPVAELAQAISDMRKKSRGATGISIIPVDVRDWTAHVPADAPAACKKVLRRLRETA